MLLIKRIFLLGLLGLSTTVFSAFAAAQLDDVDKYYLLDSLRNYSENRGIPMSDVLNHVGKLVMTGNKVSKGGFGVVMKGVHVRTDSKHNEARIDGKEWVGLPRESGQVLYTDGVRYSDSIDGFELDKLILIIFSPKEIRYMDYINSRGGIYVRKLSPLGDEVIK